MLDLFSDVSVSPFFAPERGSLAVYCYMCFRISSFGNAYELTLYVSNTPGGDVFNSVLQVVKDLNLVIGWQCNGSSSWLAWKTHAYLCIPGWLFVDRYICLYIPKEWYFKQSRTLPREEGKFCGSSSDSIAKQRFIAATWTGPWYPWYVVLHRDGVGWVSSMSGIYMTNSMIVHLIET